MLTGVQRAASDAPRSDCMSRDRGHHHPADVDDTDSRNSQEKHHREEV